MTDIKVEVLPIEQGATPDIQNVNRHTQRGRGLHENSMRKRGAGRSIFSAGKGVEVPVVMGGNQTLEIAAQLDMEIINVHTTGNRIVNVVRDDIAPNSPEFYALGIEDNEVGKISYNPDIDILAAVMADPAMQALKNEDRMLADIVEGMGMPKETKDAEAQVDRAAELQELWKTASGQLWKLGKHRLLIGDCTVRENVERLMGGERAEFCFTDPPYGVSYTGGTKKWIMLENDDEVNTYAASLPIIHEFTTEKAALYCAFASANARSVYNYFFDNGYEQRALIIWNKNHAQFGAMGSQYKQKHEPIAYCFKKGKSPHWFGENNEVTVWDIDRESKNEFHPTQKPVTLVERAMRNSSPKDCIVLEPFAGSGTTIIAAQNLSRRCYAMEISDKYGAVILERFATAFPAEEIRLIE